jgi:hypothetical protein
MPKLLVNRLLSRRVATIALGGALAAGGAASIPAVAPASSSQLAIIEDLADLSTPATALAHFRLLGANTVRVIIPWSQIAPRGSSHRKPHFDATNPNAYPAAAWVPYDNIVRQAKLDGIAVDFTVAGDTPVWSDGPGVPRSEGRTIPYFAWKPNAAEYGQFMQAVGERYDGSFTPQGQNSPLPAVHIWAIFNEPNFGEDLAPQAIKGSSVSVAPMLYRSLANAGWSALQRHHRHDTILIGEFAARGINGGPSRHAPQGLPGNYSQTKPLEFIRTLYCVDSNYREFRGSYARARGCPTTAAASRRFRRQNPGLFKAGGVGDHPYPDNLSPVRDGLGDPNFAAFPELGNLARTLDRVNRVYGSHKRYSIYNDEYGYITHPPARSHYVSPTTAAYYINWAEYLSWKNPRVKSYMQYLLADPAPSAGAYSGFASGLETYKGAKKATYYAYRMPLYMPRTSFSHRQSVEVWGDVRPAPFMTLDGFGQQTVLIQLRTGGRTFKTLNRVRLTRPGGYFDVRMKFRSSGTVRLQWTYPVADPLLAGTGALGQTVYSRTFAVKVH